MSKLRADITYSHHLNNFNITSDFTNINITDISMEKNDELLVEKNDEILIEEDSDDETDQIDIGNEFDEYLQGWTDMLKEEELANNDDDSDDIVDDITHPAVDKNAKWILGTLFKKDLNLLF